MQSSVRSLGDASFRTLPVFCGVGDESLDEVFDMTLGVGDVFAVVDQGCELGLMVAASLVDVESVGCEDRLEPLTGCGRLGISSPVCPYVRRNTFPSVSVILEMSSATEKASEVPHRSLVLERIRSHHGSLIPSEARVAERILADPEAVMYQSVTQLAGSAETSLSTVVRFCRSIGLSGFQDLKLALARETVPAVRRIQGDVEVGDSHAEVLTKVLGAGSAALNEAVKAVSSRAFSEMVRRLTDADRILFTAVGTSAPLALDAAYRLTTLGFEAIAPTDVHVQHVTASLLSADDLCLAISHTGSTRETLSTVQTAGEAGAATAALTSFDRSPLTDLVDLALVAGSRETAFRVEAMASRLVHLTVLDALFVALALEDPEAAQETLDRTGSVLGSHRF